MEKQKILTYQTIFEETANEKVGVEYWLARDLQKLLGYSEWRNFVTTLEKAKLACENSGQLASDHFVGINKMIGIGSDTERSINDIMLTRYAY